MKIFFTGQKGFPAKDISDLDESRVQALAASLYQAGHKVLISSIRGYSRPTATRFAGIEVISRASLNPEKPGGWLPLAADLWFAWRRQPDVIHVHGWKAAVLLPLLSLVCLVCPRSQKILTLSSLPETPVLISKVLSNVSSRHVTAITVPNRRLQYELLNYFGLRAIYIPDGFSAPRTTVTPAKHWGLRPGQYCLAVSNSPAELHWIADAYIRSNTRKKLVIAAGWDNAATFKLSKKYPQVHVINCGYGRAFRSLANQAAAIIIGEHNDGNSLLLQSMNANKPVVAVTSSINQETLGTTAPFVAAKDKKSLTELLSTALSQKSKVNNAGRKAGIRARNHFRWDRITEEYLQLYCHHQAIVTPVDSVMARPALR